MPGFDWPSYFQMDTDLDAYSPSPGVCILFLLVFSGARLVLIGLHTFRWIPIRMHTPPVQEPLQSLHKFLLTTPPRDNLGLVPRLSLRLVQSPPLMLMIMSSM